MDLRRCRMLRTMGQVMVIREVKILYLLILKELKEKYMPTTSYDILPGMLRYLKESKETHIPPKSESQPSYPRLML